MGRAKIKMEFKTKEKIRNNALQKGKKNLKKKAYELSILCDVPVCLIIYPYNNENNKAGTQSSEPDIWPENPEKVREIINRYISVPKDVRQKRAVNLFDILEGRKKKAEQALLKLQKRNMVMKYPSWHVSFDSFNKDQLMQTLWVLDEKLEIVKGRIAMLKQGGQGFVAPISSYPSSSLQGFGFVKSEFDEGFINGFPTYPVEMDAQLVPFSVNPLRAPTFPVTGSSYDPSQMGMNHVNVTSNSAAECDFTVGSVCYDQALRVVNHVPALSNFVPPVMWGHGDDLQFSMPVRVPMLMPNVGFGHGSYQMNGGSEYINEFEMLHG